MTPRHLSLDCQLQAYDKGLKWCREGIVVLELVFKQVQLVFFLRLLGSWLARLRIS
jgi:hypothetical protein